MPAATRCMSQPRRKALLFSSGDFTRWPRLGSTLEQVQLGLHRLPFVGVGRRRFAFDDRSPDLRQLGIERLELLLVGRHVILGKDGLDRALGDAEGAVDAIAGVGGVASC